MICKFLILLRPSAIKSSLAAFVKNGTLTDLVDVDFNGEIAHVQLDCSIDLSLAE